MPLPPRGFVVFRVLFDFGFAGIGGVLQRRFVRTCLGAGGVGRACKSAEENCGRKPLELDHLVRPSFYVPPSDFKVTRGRPQMHIILERGLRSNDAAGLKKPRRLSRGQQV
jgi:hypothetical protein